MVSERIIHLLKKEPLTTKWINAVFLDCCSVPVHSDTAEVLPKTGNEPCTVDGLIPDETDYTTQVSGEFLTILEEMFRKIPGLFALLEIKEPAVRMY
jgi:hypothetical protein